MLRASVAVRLRLDVEHLIADHYPTDDRTVMTADLWRAAGRGH
jgi:hypothetical protein